MDWSALWEFSFSASLQKICGVGKECLNAPSTPCFVLPLLGYLGYQLNLTKMLVTQ